MNQLQYEKSPYLLAHADNPVDWLPWGQAAIDRAKAEDRPVFLSIGYAACHWCHVMARESFADGEAADYALLAWGQILPVPERRLPRRRGSSDGAGGINGGEDHILVASGGRHLIRHGFAVPPSPQGEGITGDTSSVTASPCHLPLEGKAFIGEGLWSGKRKKGE